MAEQYKVLVDDNFHYMDEGERYCFGYFDSPEVAVKAMKLITEAEIVRWAFKYDSAEKLLSQYKAFGEDPFCAGTAFSAWKWDEERCKELIEMTTEELEAEKVRHKREWKEIAELRRKD